MKLINPDEIKFVIAPIAPICIGEQVHFENVAFKHDIEQIQRIEAEPVKHAHWVKQGRVFKREIFKCSNCGNFLDFSGVNAGRGDANYCPNCGARMDGEMENKS